MKLVTLGHATLNRIGTANVPGMGMERHKEVYQVREISEASPQALRELVLTIAEEHGEPRARLQNMRQVNAWDYTQQRDAVVFNIQGINVFYGTPYAVCHAHPALKIDDRYFKLEEVFAT